jgi:ketosteroid isomerase-like protein
MSADTDALQRIYDLVWVRQDWDGAMELLAPDIEWVTEGEGTLRPVHGREGVLQFFREFLEPWKSYDVRYEFLDAGDGCVVAHSRFKGVGSASGMEVEMELGQLWTLRDSVPIRQEMFRTPADAFAAAGLEPPAR